MAVRFDASGDSLTRNANLPPIANFTIAGMFKITTDRNAFSSFIAYGATVNASYYGLQTDSDGTTLVVWNGTTVATGAGLTVGTWYHLALVVDGTGANNCRAYINGVQAVSMGGNASNTATQIYIGNDKDSEFLNGCAFAVKIWDVALTAAEIAQEMWMVVPQRLSSVNGWYPLLPGATERLADYSGNGRNFTGNGTLTDEDGPGLAWDLAQWDLPGVAGGASVGFTLAVASGSSTPDTVAANVARAVALAVASGSSTPNAAASVGRALVMAVVSGSSTPDTVVAGIARGLALALSSGSSTPNAALTVARALILAVTSGSSTPNVVATVARALVLAVASGSSTPNAALTVAGIIDLALAVASGSSTPNVSLSVARGLALAAASQSSTPNTVAAAVARRLILAVASQSSTPNSVVAAVARRLMLAVTSQSSTPNSVELDFLLTLAALLDHQFRLLPRRWVFVVAGVRTISVPAARRSFEAHLMAVAEVPKDPGEELDYQFDYSTLLEGDTIAASAWAADSGDVAVDSDDNTTTTTIVRVTGGTLGTKSKIKNTVTTASGQVLVRRLVVVVQEM